MSNCDIFRVESSIFSPTPKTENKPSKFKTLGFAVFIIFGIGGLTVAAIGTSGLLHAGSLTNLGKLNSIIMIVIGGGGGIPFLVIGIVGFINTRSGSISRISEKTIIQDTRHSILEDSEETKREQEKLKKADEERRAQEEERIRQEAELEATRQGEEQERKNRAEAEKKAEEEAALKQEKELEAKKVEEEKKAKELEAARLQDEQEKLKKAEEEKKAREHDIIRQEEVRRKAEAEEKSGEKNPSQAFKDEVVFYITNNKDSPTIARDLSIIITPNLSLHDAVNIIFENCIKSQIPSLLDAIFLIDASFSLTSYDKIRRTIVEDEQHRLTNSTLIEMLKENGLDTQEDKLAACYDLAYRMNHPYIYCLSSTTISADAYTLNFLWVNLNPQDRLHDLAQNIFKDGLDMSENAECIADPDTLRQLETTEQFPKNSKVENWEGIKKSFTYKVSKWADINPKTQINVWYDSALVTQKAQQKTFEMMQAISKSRGVNIRLRDVRQLSNIRGELENSLHPGTQVYYRVDILKALIADHMMSSTEGNAQFCVISDIDVEPMSSAQIFDKRTLDYLASAGYVFNRVGLIDNFENSFFIFNRQKENVRKVHHDTIIKRTATLIEAYRRYPEGTALKPEATFDAEFVFRQYVNFRKKMQETDDELQDPRKVVKCPKSQFNFGGDFLSSDYKEEAFRFIGDSNVPYTIHGRNNEKRCYAPIDWLINWKVEPLDIVD